MELCALAISEDLSSHCKLPHGSLKMRIASPLSTIFLTIVSVFAHHILATPAGWTRNAPPNHLLSRQAPQCPLSFDTSFNAGVAGPNYLLTVDLNNDGVP